MGFNSGFKGLMAVKKVKKKVKCTLVQALTLCTGRAAHRGSSGIVLPFHDHGTRRGGRKPNIWAELLSCEGSIQSAGGGDRVRTRIFNVTVANLHEKHAVQR